MGVPQFVSFLKGWTNNAFVNGLPDIVDTLCLDANGLFHEAINDMTVYGNRKLSDTSLERKVIKNIETIILQLVTVVNPSNCLIVCVDGVAPLAKIARQRASRFAKVDEKKEDAGRQKTPVNSFDRNSISPGTSFMFELDKSLREFFKTYKTQLPSTIIYSSHLVRGEGEHKIMRYLKAPFLMDGTMRRTYTTVIYGMDADLVHLSLLTSLVSTRPIYLWRQRSSMTDVQSTVLEWLSSVGGLLYKPVVYCLRKMLTGSTLTLDQKLLFADWFKEFGCRIEERIYISIKRLLDHQDDNRCKDIVAQSDVISINILKKSITTKMGLLMTCPVQEAQAVRDFFAITLLLGNDFLPKHPILMRFDVMIRKLVDFYKEVELPLLNDQGELSITCLKGLFKKLSDFEPVVLAEEASRTFTYPFRCLDASLSSDGSELDLEKFTNLWYSLEIEPKRCDISFKYDDSVTVFSDQDIIDTKYSMTTEYIKGLKWVSLYYLGLEVNRLWCYPFYRAPLMSDISQAVNSSETLPSMSTETPLNLSPVHQLVAVMPVRSKYLLPEHVKCLMDQDSPIIDQFDVDFPIDLDGRMLEWQGVSIISFIDVDRLVSAVDECTDSTNSEKWKDGKDLIIQPDPEKVKVKKIHDSTIRHLERKREENVKSVISSNQSNLDSRNNIGYKRPFDQQSYNGRHNQRQRNGPVILVAPTPRPTTTVQSSDAPTPNKRQREPQVDQDDTKIYTWNKKPLLM